MSSTEQVEHHLALTSKQFQALSQWFEIGYEDMSDEDEIFSYAKEVAALIAEIEIGST